MLRVSPAWPVAQNGQFMPQPACEETHSVTRLAGSASARLDQGAVEQPPDRLDACVPPSHVRSRTGVSSGGQQLARRARRATAWAGRSSARGSSTRWREVVRRSWLGPERLAAPSRRRPSRRSAGVRSARCRGGLPRGAARAKVERHRGLGTGTVSARSLRPATSAAEQQATRPVPSGAASRAGPSGRRGRAAGCPCP